MEDKPDCLQKDIPTVYALQSNQTVKADNSHLISNVQKSHMDNKTIFQENSKNIFHGIHVDEFLFMSFDCFGSISKRYNYQKSDR